MTLAYSKVDRKVNPPGGFGSHGGQIHWIPNDIEVILRDKSRHRFCKEAGCVLIAQLQHLAADLDLDGRGNRQYENIKRFQVL